jgi:hypothetical protein
MLLHGLQGFHGKLITLPVRTNKRPPTRFLGRALRAFQTRGLTNGTTADHANKELSVFKGDRGAEGFADGPVSGATNSFRRSHKRAYSGSHR